MASSILLPFPSLQFSHVSSRRNVLTVSSLYQKSAPSEIYAGGLLRKSAVKFEHSLMGEILSIGANVGEVKTREKVGVVHAAWTRRSRGETATKPNRKSWSQRTDMYLRPFLLNVFFSKRFIHAKVVHRGTSKVISVASTNAKDLRNTLPSLIDDDACRTIGQLIAERSKEADVFAMAYEAKSNERIEGKLGIVLDTIKENGIIFVDR